VLPADECIDFANGLPDDLPRVSHSSLVLIFARVPTKARRGRDHGGCYPGCLVPASPLKWGREEPSGMTQRNDELYKATRIAEPVGAGVADGRSELLNGSHGTAKDFACFVPQEGHFTFHRHILGLDVI